MKKKLARILVLLMIISAFAYFAINLDKGNSASGLGEKAADFQLEDMEGEMRSLSEFKGKVVVLNFFATWCGPCVDEAPELEKFEQEYGQEIQLLIIDLGETRDRVKKFTDKYQTTSTYLFDYKMDVKDQFAVTGQPETFVIDKDGVIREHYKGPITKEGLFDLVRAYR
jgi:cytochrome c biogenesis protein CcmG, thiol:disulfide interchange protein DsbE